MSFKDEQHNPGDGLERTSVSSRTPAGPRESAPPTALSVPVVTRLITDLGKAVKAICLYPPSNSICISACERFSGELLGVLKNAGELRLGVVQDAFTYNQEPIKTVAVEDTQLPGLCYECGITDLIFNPSLTVDGIEKLLGILRSVITRSQGDVDLAEALWAESIPGFSFDRVEDLLFTDYESEIRAQYFSQQDPDAKPGLLANAEDEETVYSQMFIGEELTELEDAESESSVVFERVVRTLSDDDPEVERKPPVPSPKAREMLQRVFELDADESQKAAFALTKDAAFSEDQGLVQIASDLLDQEETLAGIADTMMVFTRAHGALIDSGRLSSAAELLRALSAARKRFAQSQPLWEKKIGEAVTSICSRERLGHLSDSLNQRPEISSEQLKDYLSCFDWTTYAALSVLLGALEHEEHRFALCEFLSQIDKQHIDLIASGMYDKRWHVVRDTAMILGHFDTTRAHKHLIKAFDHPDRRVRLEVVSCASSHRVEFVRQVALAGIRDEDGEIQDMALDMALKQSGENAFILFTELVKEIGLDKLPASATEKALLGYSLGGQERAVPLLVKLAGSRGLFKRTPAHYRREAMQALARNSAAEAEAALKKMSRSWNNDVRMLARAALDERNEESTGAGPAA